MAVFEIWDVRGRFDHPIDYAVNENKTVVANLSTAEYESLQDVIRYAVNNDKTKLNDYEAYVSGINCNVSDARKQMSDVRKSYADNSEIMAFHGFQSFAHGEVTPDTAHEIGVKFAERMWGDRFQVVVATHLNTKCLHNHFVINGTSFVDGKRFYDNKAHLKTARKVSDELCAEYGLSVIENPNGRHTPLPLYKMEQAGMPTRLNIAKAAIDEAISLSHTKEDFFKNLKRLGYKYDFRESRKYATVSPLGYGKSIRVHRMGDDYTRERIFERINENRVAVMNGKNKALSYTSYRNVTAYSIYIAKQKGGLRGLYLHYCYRLGILPKGTQRNNARLPPQLKDDLMKLDRISKEVRFLYAHKIDATEELCVYKDEVATKIDLLKKERQRLWNASRKVPDGAELKNIKEQIAICSLRLKDLREEVKCADGVLQRSQAIENKLCEIERDEKRKEKSHELFGRRS